jgi:acetoin utilization protein AcuB
MNANPTVQDYMKDAVKTIGYDQSIMRAHDIICKNLNIKHIPVLDGGKLIGIISDRDINLILSFSDVDFKSLKMEEACTLEPYIISPTTPIMEAASEMAERKFGCALVAENGRLVGIFTAFDACSALLAQMGSSASVLQEMS